MVFSIITPAFLMMFCHASILSVLFLVDLSFLALFLALPRFTHLRKSSLCLLILIQVLWKVLLFREEGQAALLYWGHRRQSKEWSLFSIAWSVVAWCGCTCSEHKEQVQGIQFENQAWSVKKEWCRMLQREESFSNESWSWTLLNSNLYFEFLWLL